MNNMPEVKIGIVAVSRDCFPESLSVTQKKSTCRELIQRNMMQRISMNVQSVS